MIVSKIQPLVDHTEWPKIDRCKSGFRSSSCNRDFSSSTRNAANFRPNATDEGQRDERKWHCAFAKCGGRSPSRKTSRHRIQKAPNRSTSSGCSIFNTTQERLPYLRHREFHRRLLCSDPRLRRGLQLLGAPALLAPRIRFADVGVLSRVWHTLMALYPFAHWARRIGKVCELSGA